MSALFIARYDGECGECGNGIVEGDRAGYVGDEVCCEACWREANDPDDPLAPTNGSDPLGSGAPRAKAAGSVLLRPPFGGPGVDPLDGKPRLPYMQGHEFNRNERNHGRPRIVLPDTKPKRNGTLITREYARVTSYIDTLEDGFGLDRHHQRLVLLGVLEMESLMLSVRAHRDSKKELDKIADRAREMARDSEKSMIGTALHRLTEDIDAGEILTKVPAMYRADLEAYRLLVDKRKIEMCYIEPATINDTLKVAGTPDRLGRMDGHSSLVVFDTKSGEGQIRYGMGKIAMQLAVYAHSMLYDSREHNVDGVTPPIRTPLDIDLATAYVLYVPATQGKAELIEVNITDGWRDAEELCRRVKAHRARKDWARVVDSVDVPTEAAPVDEVLVEIAATWDLDELRDVWRRHKKTSRWADYHVAAVQERLAELTRIAELGDAVDPPAPPAQQTSVA